MHRTFYLCNFLKAKNQNFIMDVLLSNVLDSVNKDLLKCPIRKGSYIAVDAEGKVFHTNVALPSFITLGQEINFDIIFKSVVRRKMESICSVALDLEVS